MAPLLLEKNNNLAWFCNITIPKTKKKKQNKQKTAMAFIKTFERTLEKKQYFIIIFKHLHRVFH